MTGSGLTVGELVLFGNLPNTVDEIKTNKIMLWWVITVLIYGVTKTWNCVITADAFRSCDY